jgi:hypothetical protein
MPKLVIAFAVGAAVLLGDAEGARAQVSQVMRGGSDLVLRAEPLVGEIRLDGILDESEWQAADVATDFVQQRPAVGERSTQRTEARVIYGADALYVGMRMYDTDPEGIAAILTRRDVFTIASDWAMVTVDSRFDRRSAFGFAVNPLGVKHDAYNYDDGKNDQGWDAVWDVATMVDSLGWTAEFRIPYSQLRFGADGGERTWGIQFMRDIPRIGERSHWAFMDPTVPGTASRFGMLAGLDGLDPPRRLELLPYTSGSLTRAPTADANPFQRAWDPGLATGLDFKAGLPSGLTLTGTVNPDFGQVEVDPAQINLTAFELFFPEQRPFFSEGSDVFQFGSVQSLNSYSFEEFLYSRRIGRAPQRSLPPSQFLATDAPDQTTVLGAGKVSGRTDGGWTLGVLNAVTAREQARVLTSDGEDHITVEPLTNYATTRARRDLRQGRTVIGGMVNALHRDLSDDGLQPLMHQAAYTGGIDFSHRWGNQRWVVSGYLAGSHVSGSEAALSRTQRSSSRYFMRPDAEHLELDPDRTALTGSMTHVALQRSGDWDMSLGYKQASPGFEMNDTGFQGRVDYRAVTTFAGKRHFSPRGVFRSASYAVGSTHVWNFGGDPLADQYRIMGNGQFRNFWTFGLGGGVDREAMNDRLTWGGPLARSPSSRTLNLMLGTDPRRTVQVMSNATLQRGADGSRQNQGQATVSLRPTPSTQFQIGPSLARNINNRQFVRTFADPDAEATFGQRIVFAELRQTTVSANIRLDHTFTPNLSLQLFAQPYVSAGAYSGMKEFTTPGESDFAVYGSDRGAVCSYDRAYVIHPTDAFDCPSVAPTAAEAAQDGAWLVPNPDFTFRSLRGTAVVRWEYRPGSTLFVVWQQDRSGRHPHGDLQWSRDSGGLFGEPGRNTLMMKATYWIGG